MDPKYPEASELKLAPPPEKELPEGQWSTGLYDCCDDPSHCKLTPITASILYNL